MKTITKTVQLSGDVIPMSGKGSLQEDIKILLDQPPSFNTVVFSEYND